MVKKDRLKRNTKYQLLGVVLCLLLRLDFWVCASDKGCAVGSYGGFGGRVG